MGLFRRSKKQVDPLAESMRKTDELAAEFRSDVPTAFPDGTPYPALQSYDEITDLAKRLLASGHPQGEELSMYCIKVLMNFALVASADAYKASTGVEAATAREIMLEAGWTEDERALSRALLLILDFHEKAGHQPIMDIEPGASR
ncbi:hypothetical protein ACIBI4_06245 [Streptomyces sp. NPDC050418]|uniref:hypothetical protein n=1 Tax=Streptomyces sp. NPDC050418 TaxID=3365612 RepID=UPI003787EBD8